MKLSRPRLLSTTALAGCAFISASLASAQENTPIEVTPERVPVVAAEEDIIIVRGFRRSLANSLDAKRNANQVLDAIAAEEIGQFPDQNITEAMQRIIGVQIIRSDGEGESVNIRGLAPNFTRVEVDGRSTTVTSNSDAPGRRSVLSVFSSELYDSVEIIKSPTAADIEGGVGGTVRLKTPDPLRIGKRAWGVEAGSGFADQRDDPEPSLNGFFSDVLVEDRLGVLVAGTYEQRDRRLDQFENPQRWASVIPPNLLMPMNPSLQPLIGSRFPAQLRQQQREGEAPKYNLNAKLQYRPSSELELYMTTVYTDEQREDDTARIQLQLAAGAPPGIIPPGPGPVRFTSGTVDPDTATLVEADFVRQRTDFFMSSGERDVQTFGISGGFNWRRDGWRVKGEAGFSSSEDELREFRAAGRIGADGPGSYSIINDPEYRRSR